MAKQGQQQLDFWSQSDGGNIISTSLHTEMQRSYLEYAMSVIVGRALPDARDGLKPVHRRIIYAMHELGLLPDRPFRKCARVVGDVLGKYHPHGDQSVYDALVRLVQDFSSRYPLLAGHGNFGSVDNDPAAAMRYTECRLASIGNEALLGEIEEEVVDFVDNFDGSEQEPAVLPAQLPMLLLNGATGIAVGMATNIPPHNLSEVIDGAIALIDNPNLPDDDLLKLIPAPDFPTGGIIMNVEGVREAYLTGKGSVTIRGVASVEQLGGKGTGKRQKQAIIVTELPYQVNKSAWIEKIAELVNNNKIEGISDIRDESDRRGMRVVIELKKDVVPAVVIDQLYRQTALQSNFGVILLALKGSQPKQMTLRELLQEFLGFREETLSKRFRYELKKAQEKSHLLEGLVLVLQDLDRLIRILRFANNSNLAKTDLQTEFTLSETQAEAILSMPLRRITAIEQQKIREDLDALQQQIAKLEKLLSDRRELMKFLKKELRDHKKRHSDPRRTHLAWQLLENHQNATQNAVDIEVTAEISEPPKPKGKKGDRSIQQTIETEQVGRVIEKAPEKKYRATNTKQSQPIEVPLISLSTELNIPIAEPQDITVQLTYKGYIKSFENGKAPQLLDLHDDVTIASYDTRSDREMVVLTNSGKAFPLALANVPTVKGKGRGTPLITLLPDSSESLVSQFVWEKNPESTEGLVLLSSQGKIKRSPLAEFADMTARGLIAVKFKEDDALFWADVVSLDQELAIATSAGRILRFKADETQIPTVGRAAAGNIALRLGSTETQIGVSILDLTKYPSSELILITAEGFAKRIAATNIRAAVRGAIGAQCFKFPSRTDKLVSMAAIANPRLDLPVTFLIGQDHDLGLRTVQMPLGAIPLELPNSQGRSIFAGESDLVRSERVIRVVTA
ncbi:MAG: DNA topoisomerase (ATP-hydrolyzing) subunit A [Pseudanabaena sp.]|jgi:DNA gyrase subunit A|uniref:DNA gyrase/topoisomerase IV subunit A n=1 Tax=Pseudanabaena mucicola TaxID=71190 RepID=UPI00257752E0|nr:DNA topoisomerase (ATP-hydrolyzing) [Pseudanabaena mucicola]MCA6523192.1 DNA topoisomerase 4 subunit A [Pseudanabaena sp. M051S1SP2A07QC]MCA6572243.1 DNA topoisomerase 4 subunit A [Pseudanabaena sp. M53BS1SP1A06MG]MCA6584262.1 DNA topoisomerase 4 subunit A [Pseudanabaena sp. M34BS1SP1A06MG]MCA6589943.1 DNA topoisomerase 4 subunit A [Pseudanabaena sp. M109S1SP1A06QC]MCA6593006.1 DNA topoisomerase 4 subunit A [Pseudanabaena sp. M38BS1SP1A06MG]MCA6602623.1 DNA topoisomerase 4 subunit A [Pseud